MRRIRELLSGVGWVKGAAYAVGALVVLWVAWTIVYRLFFQGDDLAKAKGTAVVTQEVSNGAAHTTAATIAAVQTREAEQQQVRVIVTQGRERVNEAWHGETVGADVDRAGRAALCGVHDTPDFCGGTAAPALQPVR